MYAWHTQGRASITLQGRRYAAATGVSGSASLKDVDSKHTFSFALPVLLLLFWTAALPPVRQIGSAFARTICWHGRHTWSCGYVTIISQRTPFIHRRYVSSLCSSTVTSDSTNLRRPAAGTTVDGRTSRPAVRTGGQTPEGIKGTEREPALFPHLLSMDISIALLNPDLVDSSFKNSASCPLPLSLSIYETIAN